MEQRTCTGFRWWPGKMAGVGRDGGQCRWVPELGPRGLIGTRGALGGSRVRQGRMGWGMQLWHDGMSPLTTALAPFLGRVNPTATTNGKSAREPVAKCKLDQYKKKKIPVSTGQISPRDKLCYSSGNLEKCP